MINRSNYVSVIGLRSLRSKKCSKVLAFRLTFRNFASETFRSLMRFFKQKDRGPYPKSFAKRLTWSIMLRMLIVMGIPTALLFGLGYAMAALTADAVCERILKGQSQDVRRIASDLYVAAVNTAPIIEENLDDPQRMRELLERMVRLNPYVRSCGLSFAADYFPKEGRSFCLYAVRHDSTTIETRKLGVEENDYLQTEWFTKAMAAKEGFWGKAFFDHLNNDKPVVAYLKPIRDRQGRNVAVLGVDMDVEWLSTKMENLGGMDSTGSWRAVNAIYFFMVDTSGTYLIHPDKKRVINRKMQPYFSEDPDTVVGNILASKGGSSFDARLDDTDVYIFYTPVKYTQWTLAYVVPELIIDVFGYFLGTMLLLLIIIGLLVVWFFGRKAIKRAVKPINQLARSADEVAKGNFHAQLPDINTRDEIHLLRDSFGQMQRSLSQYVDELRSTTALKASIESELKIAHNIQMSMLPKTFPPYPERKDVDIFGQVTPAKAVGGDLFDFYIRDEKLFFCIGDVSGKGVPASLVMAVTRALFRNVSAHVAEPDVIVAAINQSIAQENDMNMFVTLFLGVLDLETGRLLYANGGHDAPMLIGQGVGVLPCDANLPVGVIRDWKYSLQEARVEPGTTIFLFTDGLSEAEDIGHNQFGEQRINDLANLLLSRGEQDPKTLIARMSEAVRNFVGDAEQSDDLTMLAIQYKK